MKSNQAGGGAGELLLQYIFGNIQIDSLHDEILLKLNKFRLFALSDVVPAVTKRAMVKDDDGQHVIK
jgi:hypothetical protein